MREVRDAPSDRSASTADGRVAAVPGGPSSSLLHLSDLHFGREDAAAEVALVRLTEQLRPAALVVTGDLTQRATRPQFEAARRFLDRLPVRHRLVLPGNHDVPLWALWERAFTPWRRYAQRFGGEREPVLNLPFLRLVAVDSVRPARHQRGALARDQIDRVARCLAGAAPGQWRVVALHHPMAPGDADGDPRDAVDGAAAAAHAWATHGVDLVLGGHTHQPAVLPLHERWQELPRRLWAIQGGTAVSRRVRHGQPPSVNRLVFDPRDAREASADVQRWDFDRARAAFVAGPQVRVAAASR